MKNKLLIYQIFTRLFGNTQSHCIPWGTKEQNGVGKFDDISTTALESIKNLGVTHIWYTGVLHHALIGDYTAQGISNDHPDVVKGRAGSPYAIRDYYNVNPDLANNPDKRLDEFRELIKRTHDCGLKVIIDIVPNHVARNYKSISKKQGIIDFGQEDNSYFEYMRNNDFYYIPGKQYQNPDWIDGYSPLGGNTEANLKPYHEYPAKWTGNGSREAKPHPHDWYETVKINYGIRPDGSKDFPILPESYRNLDHTEHCKFWENRDLPSSWKKWFQIADFWLSLGVDGFRYDMAELVPVEFWSYLNSNIKNKKPDSLLIAEVYQPDQFDNYIQLGKMDLLYDKVDMYDTLKGIIQNQKSCNDIFPVTERYYNYSDRLLHFLENHDEQRIASPEFAGDPFLALPAMVLSTTIDKGAVLIYFGQETGEKATDNPGFGSASRTSIFDYTSVPSHQRWMNFGKFDGGLLEENEKDLRQYYSQLMNFVLNSEALTGPFYDLHRHNAWNTKNYPGNKIYSFARWSGNEKLLVLCNFDQNIRASFQFSIYSGLIELWELQTGKFAFKNLFDDRVSFLVVEQDRAYIDITIDPLESLILQIQ